MAPRSADGQAMKYMRRSASMAREMGKVEVVIWVVGTAIVLAIVMYSMGIFDIIAHMISQINTKLSN
jgi:L-lactate permease